MANATRVALLFRIPCYDCGYISMSDKYKDFWGAVGFVVFFLLFTLLLLRACDGGWSVGGLDIPEKL